jgi:hypothetical protein
MGYFPRDSTGLPGVIFVHLVAAVTLVKRCHHEHVRALSRYRSLSHVWSPRLGQLSVPGKSTRRNTGRRAHQTYVGNENSDEQKGQRYSHPYLLLRDLYNKGRG